MRAERDRPRPSPGPTYFYPRGTVRVRFLSRPNRFLATVRSPRGETWEAHLPNPGRLRELLLPGRTTAYVTAASGSRSPEGRRTRWTLVSVNGGEGGQTGVSVDTLLASRLVGPALARRLLSPLSRWGTWRSEVTWGPHRFDHGVLPRAPGARPRALLEVKSSNLREGTTALFPDAPTSRGTSHVESLARFARSGGRAALLFVVQRDDVKEVRPYGAMDPAFARAVTAAERAGVRILGRTLHVRPEGATWGEELPVRAPRWEPAADLSSPGSGRSLKRPGGPSGRARPSAHVP